MNDDTSDMGHPDVGSDGEGAISMTETERAIDPLLFRRVCGNYATGVAVVTVLGRDEKPLGVTVNSFSSVSLDPPLVQFSLDRSASVYPAFERAAAFAINVLTRGQEWLSVRFAAQSNGFEEVAHVVWDSGCPIIDGCLANIECGRYAVYDGGDHVIILGRVCRLDCSSDGRPLLFYRGAYGTFT